MDDDQIEFLVDRVLKPGKQGAKAAHTKMEQKFEGDRKKVLPLRRIRAFMSRFLQMAKEGKYTEQVQRARVKLGVAPECDNGSDVSDDEEEVADYGGEFGGTVRAQPDERQCLDPKSNTAAGITIGTTVVTWHPECKEHGLPAAWLRGTVRKHQKKAFGVDWDVSAYKGAGKVMYEAQVQLRHDSYGIEGYWFIVDGAGGNGNNTASSSNSSTTTATTTTASSGTSRAERATRRAAEQAAGQ